MAGSVVMPVARRRGGVAPSSRRAWLLVAAAALVMVAMCVADDSTPATTIGSGSGSGSGSAPPPIHTNDDASPTGSNHWYNLGPALRSVGVFDLMGESNGALGARLRQMCTAAETKDLFVPSGCPNLGVFETASVHLGEQKQTADLVTNVVSTTGLPASIMSYFSAATNFNLTAKNCHTLACALDVAFNIKNQKYQAAVDISANAFVSALAFQGVVEFVDTDNNGVFEPSVDQFVSSYDFLVPSYANEPLWGPMTNVAQERPDGTVEYTLNVTTQDNVVSIEYITSNERVPGIVNTEVNMEIRNFPFKGSRDTSKLAIMAYVATSNHGAQLTPGKADFTLEVQSGGHQGQFSWKPSAAASAKTVDEASPVDVGFSGWMKVSAVMEEALLNSIAVVGLSTNDNGATDTKARLAYFSFDTLGPNYVYWDPQMSFGHAASEWTQSELVIVAMAAVGAVVLGFVATALFVTRRRARARAKAETKGVLKHLLKTSAPRSSHAAAGSVMASPVAVVGGSINSGPNVVASSKDTKPYARRVSVSSASVIAASVAPSVAASVAAPAAHMPEPPMYHQIVECHACSEGGAYGDGFCANCGSKLD